MPKSTLTLVELGKTEYIVYLKYDLNLWTRGLTGKSLIGIQQLTSFHTLGYLVMGAEGFNDLYQSIEINNRVQTEIDANFRLFNAVQL